MILTAKWCYTSLINYNYYYLIELLINNNYIATNFTKGKAEMWTIFNSKYVIAYLRMHNYTLLYISKK